MRLETRFVAPDQRSDGVAQWMLRLRIYPDEFSMPRTVPAPAPAELDRLSEAVASLSAVPPLSEADAFASFASAVGAARGLLLWRTNVVPDGAGGLRVDRTAETKRGSFQAHAPTGLPERLEVWLVHTDGTRELGARLTLDLAAIGADLDLTLFEVTPGRLPETWWLSYRRAVEVGLGVDLDVGVVPPALDALVVLGIGTTEAAAAVDLHNRGGRLAVLAPGTPTNTVAGEPTTDFGETGDSLYPLLHTDPSGQQSTVAALTALTGRVPPAALPVLGGDLDCYGPGSLAVQGLWPALWGRAFSDVVGAGDREPDVARWAIRNLAVEGPRPAIRIGQQPYGLLPTSSFGSWVDSPGDGTAEIERRIRGWGLGWRAGAAAAARTANRRAPGADSAELLEVLGVHAPSRYWEVRPIADRYVIDALRALAGMPGLPSDEWDRLTAVAWRDRPAALAPTGPAARSGPVPRPPGDERDEAKRLKELCTMEPEALYSQGISGLGLVGHLFREALVSARAIVGEAAERLRAGTPVALGQPLPWDDELQYRSHVLQGGSVAVTDLAASNDRAAGEVAARFRDVQEALSVLADLWEAAPAPLFRAVLAALDTAAFRVDPWLTGIAERRLQQLIAANAPFMLGAYGWVDAPAPFSTLPADALAPGPTAAGILHAPSHAQALTAALLRDAAVRYPGADNWRLTIDSAKVRAAVALAERVRLGVHPYEALGLEVEKIAGDWETVRILRREYPLALDQQQRRVCDGARVLQAARDGTLVTGLPADLPDRIAPLDEVLDTYSDLLVADGVYALVTGHGDLANAAMEAAAGLGAPPDLRAIRTPRAAGTVRVSAWALLPPGAGDPGPGADPAVVADPAFAALLAAEVGAGALDAEDPPARKARDRLAAVLGGGEDEAPVPSLTGGDYEGLTAAADTALRAAVVADLGARLARLRQLLQAAHDDLAILDPSSAGAAATVTAAARRWMVDLTGVAPADPGAVVPTVAELQAALLSALGDRLASPSAAAPTGTTSAGGSGVPDVAVNALRRAIRGVAGRPELPVLPLVDRALLPVLRPVPDADRTWLELVAAVHPRLAPLEARQLDPSIPTWPAAVAAPAASTDPWHATGPVLVAYGPDVTDAAGPVAVAALEGWTDSVPSRRHATTAAFGFNAPKSRAPQAVLLAVPPDVSRRLTNGDLLDVILETRELVHARAARPTDLAELPFATPAAFVHAGKPLGFLDGWPP
ncbi:MAG: hypothetical protein ACR2F6_00420 [Mycobacteriales bacterium]